MVGRVAHVWEIVVVVARNVQRQRSTLVETASATVKAMAMCSTVKTGMHVRAADGVGVGEVGPWRCV